VQSGQILFAVKLHILRIPKFIKTLPAAENATYSIISFWYNFNCEFNCKSLNLNVHPSAGS